MFSVVDQCKVAVAGEISGSEFWPGDEMTKQASKQTSLTLRAGN